ncbi:unnamed protein product [Parajaminaea phylloscopi]
MEQQLAACLEATLSPDSAVRSQAEAALLDLHSHRPCGFALCNLITSSSGLPIQIRQSAALSLRKWIKERWSPLFEVYKGFGQDEKPVAAEDKPPVRRALLQVLALPGVEERRLRTAAAAALSNIASCDWPDDFPELLPSVEALLKGRGAGGVVDDETRHRAHGALVFLSEFWSSEMDERQILGGAKDMLPLIESVLADSQSFPPGLRSRCVLIFRQLLSSLYMVKGTYPEASKQIAAEVIPRWLAVLEQIIALDLSASLLSAGVTDDDKQGQLSLVNEAWRTLKIALHFRPQIKDRLADILGVAIETLQRLSHPFGSMYLAEDGAPQPLDAADGDSHTTSTLPNLVCSIIDFTSEAVRGGRVRAMLVESPGLGPSQALRALFSCLVDYAQVTSEEEEEWSSDANAFVLASDEDGVEFGLRVACADLVQDLLDSYPRASIQCLSETVSNASTSPSWKSVEAALAILGGVGEEVRDIVATSAAEKTLDLEAVFQSAVLPNVQSRSHPLLTGRAYIFASQFASALPAELATQFVAAAVQALESDSLGSSEETLIIKLSAVRCIKNFYRQLSGSLLAPYTPRIIARLGPLLSQATEETLVLILETIQCVVSDQAASAAAAADATAVSPQTYAELVQAALQVWRAHPNDYIMLSVVSDLLESLASQRSADLAQTVLQVAQSTLGPAILSAAVPQEPDAETLLESAVSLAESLLKGSRNETLTACGSVDCLLGPLLCALQNSEDRDVLQSGIGCLTLLVRKASEHVGAWKDARAGTSAVDCFLAIISRLLVVDSESGGLRVGELLIALLRKMPQEVLPVLPDLLAAMLRRLATAKTATFAQSLILPFAFLIKDQCDVVLDLLQSTRVPADADGAEKSGLEVLATKWVDNAETIQGYWAQRLSTFALTRLLGAWAQGGQRSSALEAVVVQGDAIPDTSGLIRTRSRSRADPPKFTSVPLPVKVLKVLLSDWEHSTTGPGAGPGPAGDDHADVPSDDEDQEWDDDDDDDDGRAGKEDDIFLSDLMHGGVGLDGEMDDEDEDDEDAKEDEVYQMDMRSYLAAFFRDVSQSARASMLAQGLNGEEQHKLREILSSGAGAAA